MALNATEVRIGVSGNLYRAPVGTAMPTDVTTALAAAYKELGYTETGPSMAVDVNKEQFTPWQTQMPVREQVTSQMISSTFSLWQRNADTLKLAWGGGTVTETPVVPATTPATTTRVFTPPTTATVNEGAFIFEIADGLIKDRICVPRASVSLSGDVAFAKDEVTAFEVELTFLQPASGPSWYLLTNDTALAAGA